MADDKRKDWWLYLPKTLFGQEQQQAQAGSPQAIGAPAGTPATAGASASGYTGAGPDGVVQTDRRTPGIGAPSSDKHEGEWVFSADEVQAIGPDVLQGMSDAARQGNLDVNQLRRGIGQPAKPGFAKGTGRTKLMPDRDESVADQSVSQDFKSTPKTNLMKPTVDMPLAIGAPSINPPPLNPEPVVSFDPANSYGDLRALYTAEGANNPAKLPSGLPAGDMTQVTVEGPELAIPDATVTDVTLGTQTDPTSIRDAVEADATRTFEYGLNRQAAAGAASTGALKQELAQRGIGGEAALSALQVQKRDIEGERSKAIGEQSQFMRENIDDMTAARQGEISTLEGDAAGYLQTMSTTEGYDWRTDPTAQNKLQSVWEAQGGEGTFPEIWADKFVDGATQSPADAMGNTIMDQDWVQALPDESVWDDDGNLVTLGKDAIQQNLPQLQFMTTFGADLTFARDPETGAINMVDRSTGLDFGEDPTMVTVTTDDYDVTNPDDITAATGILNNNFFSGVSDGGVTQWLSNNPGSDYPPTEDAWNDWSLSDRTWDLTDDDDRLALAELMSTHGDATGYSTDQMKLYLALNDGKIGSVSDFNRWMETAGDTENIRQFFNGNITDLTPNDRKLLEKVAAAKTLLGQRNNMSDEEWQQALEDGEWGDDATLNLYAGLMDYESVAVQGSSIYASGTPGADGRVNSGDVDFKRGDGWFAMDTTQELKDFANDNAGKMVEIDGKMYLVNPEQPLAYTDTGRVETWGLCVYDPATNAWKVWNPYVIRDHCGESDWTEDPKDANLDPGFYDVYTGTKKTNMTGANGTMFRSMDPNEVFKSTYL